MRMWKLTLFWAIWTWTSVFELDASLVPLYWLVDYQSTISPNSEAWGYDTDSGLFGVLEELRCNTSVSTVAGPAMRGIVVWEGATIDLTGSNNLTGSNVSLQTNIFPNVSPVKVETNTSGRPVGLLFDVTNPGLPYIYTCYASQGALGSAPSTTLCRGLVPTVFMYYCHNPVKNQPPPPTATLAPPPTGDPVRGGPKTDVGVIVGGSVAGGVAFVVLLAVAGVSLRWWRRRRARSNHRTVDARHHVVSETIVVDEPTSREPQPPRDDSPPVDAQVPEQADGRLLKGLHVPAITTNASCDPSLPDTSLTRTTLSGGPPPFRTLPEDLTPIEALQAQLNVLHASGVVLRSRFVLGDRSERRVGGQGLVAFATHVRNARQQYAVKFFLEQRSFDTEAAYYNNPALRHILPDVEDIVDGGELVILGRPLPPMVIMARGESLDEWQGRCPADFAQSMTIMLHVTRRLAEIHEAGIAHRDLKPGNVILYPGRNAWTIIDFGAGACIGSLAPLTCTFSYAAPETVLAMLRGERQVVVDAAVDVWALGVMAWELFTRTRVFPLASKKFVAETMARSLSLPWEDSASPSFNSNMRRLGFMKDGILRMLARDPRDRVPLAAVLRLWHDCLQRETTEDADSNVPSL